MNYLNADSIASIKLINVGVQLKIAIYEILIFLEQINIHVAIIESLNFSASIFQFLSY